MRNLIRRQIELLKLLSKQKEYKPASFLSKALNVSTKTIYSDISVLTKETEKYSIELIRLPRVGIKIEGSNENINKLILEICNEKLDKQFIYNPEFRRIWIVKKAVVDCEKISLEAASKKFIVSKTSLYQDIASINEVIHKVGDVELVIGDNGFEITGSESQIENALKTFLLHTKKDELFTEFTNKINQMFDLKVVKVVSKLILEDFSELTDIISEYYLKSLLIVIIVQTARLKKGFHMEKEESLSYNNIQHMETYIIANSIAEELKATLNIQYDNNDMEYLCRQLFAHRLTNQVKNMASSYEEASKSIIRKMSKIQKLDLTQDQRLYESLLYHLPPMILRLQKKIYIKNPMLDNIKEQFPELFTTMWYALAEIESKFKVILTEDEVSLILLHFQVALDSFAKVGNIVVVCTYGASSSQLILSRVKQILPSKDRITVMNLKKLAEIDLSNVDLVITSVEIENLEIPYVKVNPLLTKDDYTNILDAYTKQVLLIKNNICDCKEKILKTTLLKKYLDMEYMIIQKEFQTKEECLECIVDLLEKRGDVEKTFRQSLFQREMIGFTSLDTGVALPHADPKTVKKARIVVLTLKEPIDWGGVKVSLVITTAFPEEKMNHIGDVINELYQLIGEKEYVDKFVQVENKTEMMIRFEE